MPPPPMPLVTLALYLCFLVNIDSRIQQQRAWLLSVRQFLATAFGWQHLDVLNSSHSSLGWESNQFGFQILLHAHVSVMTLLGITWLFEGKLLIACNAFEIAATFALAIYLQCSRRTCTWLFRWNCLGTFAGQYWVWEEFGDGEFRRTVTYRVLANLIFIESLEEGLLHMVATCVFMDEYAARWRWTEQALHIPFMLFLFGNVPLHVLGVSEWICVGTAKHTSQIRAKRFLRNMHFLSVLISACVVYWSYSGMGEVVYFRAKSVFCFAFAGLLRLTSFGPRFDAWWAPNVVYDESTQEVPLRLVFDPRSAASMLGQGRITAVLSPLPWRQPPAVFAALSIALCLLNLPLLLLGLMTLRAGHVTMTNRAVSAVQWETFSLVGALLLVCDTEWEGELLLTMAYISLFSSLLITAARELGMSKVKQERDSENFLSHAVKQKYAAVGACVDHLLERAASSSSTATTSTLLQQVKDECRKGHDRCHATNLYRMLIQQGPKARLQKRQFGELKPFLLALAGGGSVGGDTATGGRGMAPLSLLAGVVDFDGDLVRFPNAQLLFDWEVLALCLAEWTRTSGRLQYIRMEHSSSAAVCGVGGDDDDLTELVRVELCVDHLSVNHNFTAMLDTLAESLCGRFVGNTLVLDRVPYKAVTTTSPAAAATNREAPNNKYAELAKLRFAIVDDNKLVRRNCENILIKTLGVPPERVTTCGASASEARLFSHKMKRRYDVVIFDQFLDYCDDDDDGNGNDDENVMLQGVDLASECRDVGFRGCLVLHSSVADIHSLASSSKGLFHGAVEKSADKYVFLDGLLAAWQAYSSAVGV